MAFDLDEIDPFFAELQAAINLPAFKGLDVDTISALLDEMESAEPCVNSQSSPEANAAAQRKRKLSTTERRKQEKALLLEALAQLQQQAQYIKTQLLQDQPTRNFQLELQAQRERDETQRKLHENYQIWVSIAREQRFAGRVTKLLDQLNAPVKVTACFRWCGMG